jgi:sterol desaturase/sphingolipid hydroxylase (fatty acid hydroxylase superfamily)
MNNTKSRKQLDSKVTYEPSLQMTTKLCSTDGSWSDENDDHDPLLAESESSPPESAIERTIPWIGALVWPLMSTVPLLLSSEYSPISYQDIFPVSWYEYEPNGRPKPLGLILGILAVGVGQFWVCFFFYLFKYGYLSARPCREPLSIQTKGARVYDFMEGLLTHLAQVEGFVLLMSYLTITWMAGIMPKAYYTFDGTIQYKELFLCLLIQDGLQYTVHLLEHIVSPSFYQISHKPHHRFINPRLFDAFNGSFLDTICMVVIPLFLTSQIVRNCNVWTYMSFGSSYSCWLTLIHSEYAFCWDGMFRLLGLGTPADHHVHHKFFKFNYGHLFMWFDRLAGTYRNPRSFAPRVFNQKV